jgi:chromosome segregation ATPase
MSDNTDDGFPRASVGAPLVPAVYQSILDDQENTIAEQAAEIERLKHDIDALKFDTGTLTADRDTLRLEVQRLKDLSFEAQDRYAALEAERDEARRASETVHGHYVLALKQRDEAVASTRAECDKGYEALFRAHQQMVAERDELRAELAKAEKEIAHMRESNGRADDYSANLERVIEAANVNAGAMVNLLIAMANAGLPMPGLVPLSPKEPHHD